MALELTAEVTKLKITDETLLWLRVEAAFTGKTHQQIAREVLHEWALRVREEIHEKHRLSKALAIGEGTSGGFSGNLRGASDK